MVRSILSAAMHKFVYTDNPRLEDADVESTYTRYCDDWSQPVICVGSWTTVGSAVHAFMTSSPYTIALTGVAFLVVAGMGYARATTERVYKKVVHDINSTEGRFKEYTERAEIISKQLDEKITALTQLQGKLDVTESNLEKIQKERKTLQESFDKLVAQTPGITITVDNALQGAARFRDVSEQLGKQIVNLTNERIEIKSQSDAMAGKKGEMLTTLREFQRRCDDIAERYDDFVTANESLKTNVATLTADKKDLQTTIVDLNTQLTSIKTNEAALEKLLAAKSTHTEALKKTVIEQRTETADTKTVIAELRAQVRELRAQLSTDVVIHVADP